MSTPNDPHPTKGPGHVILYDYYKPTLYPGKYEIEARQDIETSNGQRISVYNYNSLTTVPADLNQLPSPPPIERQRFEVLASHFQIDPKAVNSVYPPDGAADEGRILPHIVFNDPHLPWETTPFPRAAEPAFQQRVWPPWLALVVFDPKELEFDLAAHSALRIPAKAKHSPYSGAYSMMVSDYLTQVEAKPDFNKGYDFDRTRLKYMGTSSAPVDVIFPNKDLVNDVLKTQQNTGPENKGLYSICVSHRSGPLLAMNPDNPPAPRPQVVHLISLECLVDEDGNLVRPTAVSGSDRVGLVSLYSWTYMATPPSSNNVISHMRELGVGKQPLMAPRPVLEALTASVSQGKEIQKTAAKKLKERLQQGYTLTRWRTATGEETAAFNRGPLTPNFVSFRPSKENSNWPDSSNTGKDFQILDRSTGLMDLTYSAAWQLGKALAIGDTVFAQALLRFRSTVHHRASSQSRLFASNITPASQLLSRLTGTLEEMSSTAALGHTPTRISLPIASSETPIDDSNLARLLHSNTLREVSLLAGFGASNSSGLENNPDFEVIKKWMDKKLLLSGIPFQYLVTDPSYLSSAPHGKVIRGKVDLLPEALRFFYIDDNWLDCFLDGALSTANHADLVNDSVRRAIKQVYNEYLKATKRPTPRYGFLLRSTIVKSIPDLRVTVKYRKSDGHGGWTEGSDRNPVLRHTRLDEYTVLSLLECLPEDLYSIIISQPAHQQRFVAPIPPVQGDKYSIKRLYTTGAPEKSPSQRGPGGLGGSATDGMWEDIFQADVSAWYNSRTRCVNIERMKADLETLLPFSDPPAEFNAPIGSAVLALELNDKSYHLEIQPPELSTLSSNLPQRQLWLRPLLAVQPENVPRPVGSIISHSGIAGAEARSVVRPSVELRPSSLHSEMRMLNLVSHNFSSTPILSGPRIEITPSAPPILIQERYLLSVHPSSRPTPPLPFSGPENRRVSSSMDYVPTKSTQLVDLVFTLRRNLFGVNSGILVSSLTIIVPTTTTDASAQGGEEPLIVAPYKGSGASMLHNKRLTPILTAASGQLQIKLVARNAAPKSELPLKNTYTAEASFILKGCEIAATKTPVAVEVMGEGIVQRGLAKVAVRRKGRRGLESQPVTVQNWEVPVVKKDVEL